MRNNKRGQVGLFVIIGIVVLVVIVAIFFLSDKIQLPSSTSDVQKQMEVTLQGISEHIGECVETNSVEVIKTIVDNGGLLSTPNHVIAYHATNYRVLCSYYPGKEGCASTPLVKEQINELIQSRLREDVNRCIQLNQFKDEDMDLVIGEMNLTTQINKDNLRVDVDYPITLKKDKITKSVSKFVKIVNVPIGEIIDVTNDILNIEAVGRDFDPLSYGLLSLGRDSVVIKEPYPNKVFIIQIDNNPSVFKFAIEGRDRFA